MSTSLPAPPKHRAAGSAKRVHPSGLNYETRLKWNIAILITELFLAQIGIWGLFIKLLNGLIGDTFSWLIDWTLILIPLFNVLEALWSQANRPVQHAPPPTRTIAMTPVQKRVQSLSTSVPASILNNSVPRGLAYSQTDSTPTRRDLRFPDVPAVYNPDSSYASSPSPSVQARSRMKASSQTAQRDLFSSRSSSLEPSDNPAPSPTLLPPSAASSTRNRRRAEGGNSRESSPFSISSLSLKNVPKPGRALDSSALHRLVS